MGRITPFTIPFKHKHINSRLLIRPLITAEQRPPRCVCGGVCLRGRGRAGGSPQCLSSSLRVGLCQSAGLGLTHTHTSGDKGSIGLAVADGGFKKKKKKEKKKGPVKLKAASIGHCVCVCSCAGCGFGVKVGVGWYRGIWHLLKSNDLIGNHPQPSFYETERKRKMAPGRQPTQFNKRKFSLGPVFISSPFHIYTQNWRDEGIFNLMSLFHFLVELLRRQRSATLQMLLLSFAVKYKTA